MATTTGLFTRVFVERDAGAKGAAVRGKGASVVKTMVRPVWDTGQINL
jgi:hypothetical protein